MPSLFTRPQPSAPQPVVAPTLLAVGTPTPSGVSPAGPDVADVVPGQVITAAWGSSVADDLAELWANKVANGGNVTTIRQLNQAAYDAITTKDSATLYIIT